MILDTLVHPENWIETEPEPPEPLARNLTVLRNVLEVATSNRSLTIRQLLKIIKGWRKNNSELNAVRAIYAALVKDRKLLEEEQAKTTPDPDLVANLQTAIDTHIAGIEARKPPNAVDSPADTLKALLAGESVGGIPACKGFKHKEVVEIIKEFASERELTYSRLPTS